MINNITKLLQGMFSKKKEELAKTEFPLPAEPIEIALEPRTDTVPFGTLDDGLMHTSLLGKIELIGHEGICLQLYLDSVGVRTIGPGATVTEIPNIESLPWSYTITMKEAMDLFDKSLAKYENAIRGALKRPIKQAQFDALVSWAYNVGIGWVPKAGVIKLLNRGVENKAQLAAALMQYNKPPEDLGRRAKEAKLLTTGVYSNGGKALLFPVNLKTHKPQYNKGKEILVKDYL
jgi:lysozyme